MAEINVSSGETSPFGVSQLNKGINFALFSHNATSVTLCLLLPQSDNHIELVLDPSINKTEDIWHICVEDLPLRDVLYRYRVDGPREMNQGHRFNSKILLLDPYAKLVKGRSFFGDINQNYVQFYGTYDFESPPFNWGDEHPLPNIPEKDLVIYEMNVRAFTSDESSGIDPAIRGSYLGVIEKIPYLLDLAINAVELMPVFEFDELEFQKHHNPRDHMVNTWGYSPVNFFAPMSCYASGEGDPIKASKEFKEMVKALHSAGIEIILDVVYNHTNGSDYEYPYTISFPGIDNRVYYMLDSNNQPLNYSGCGNTINCNHPDVMKLILDSLRHWVTEYHVDGFRFDLAGVLCRDTDGSPLEDPPLIRAITIDPVLQRCKLIAEPWDCEVSLVGNFPSWDRWAEWNGVYRDDVRQFIKGDYGMKGRFARRIAGSSDLYQVYQRRPYHSVNFITAHDGFTLRDLVTYESKHNEANGEGGNDGCNDNHSRNYGVEGETGDPDINSIRTRQMKNFHLVLMISQGTPMMLMGDEYGHTRYGNNNSYGHDDALNNFQWKELDARRQNHFRFFSEVIKFRHLHHIFKHENFLNEGDITWHENQWENHESTFLAFTLHDGVNGQDIYAAFNAHDSWVDHHLPLPPPGKQWFRVVDTNLESPGDFVNEGVPGLAEKYNMAPFSSILLKSM